MKKTRNKITIIGSKYEPQLLELIPIENLPDFIGGKSPVSEYGEYMNKEQGPWVVEKSSVDDKKHEKSDGKKPEEKKQTEPDEKKSEKLEEHKQEKSDEKN